MYSTIQTSDDIFMVFPVTVSVCLTCHLESKTWSERLCRHDHVDDWKRKSRVPALEEGAWADRWGETSTPSQCYWPMEAGVGRSEDGQHVSECCFGFLKAITAIPFYQSFAGAYFTGSRRTRMCPRRVAQLSRAAKEASRHHHTPPVCISHDDRCSRPSVNLSPIIPTCRLNKWWTPAQITGRCTTSLLQLI